MKSTHSFHRHKSLSYEVRSEWENERATEWASEWVSGASERVNGGANGPVLNSIRRFYSHTTLCSTGSDSYKLIALSYDALPSKEKVTLGSIESFYRDRHWVHSWIFWSYWSPRNNNMPHFSRWLMGVSRFYSSFFYAALSSESLLSLWVCTE